MYSKFYECAYTAHEDYTHVENDASYMMRRELASDGQGEKLLIFFEGSNGKVDWKINFMFAAKPYRDMKDTWRCHRGFLKNWKIIEDYVKNDINDPIVTEIEIVGYSHGGALAQLCYEYVKFNRPDVKVTGYGFGSPRVLCGKLSDEVKKRFEGFVVVRNGNDLVTHMPPEMFGYYHVCDMLNIGTPWTFKDFLKYWKENGFKKAMEFHTYLPPVRDHYPHLYCEGLIAEEIAEASKEN